jgi:outer membrane phospholipase A
MLAVQLRRFAVVLCLFGLAPLPALAEIHQVLDLPSKPLEAGQRGELSLYLTNDGPSTETARIDSEIRAEIVSNGHTEPVTLTLVSAGQAGEKALPPGRFLRVTYAFTVPEGVTGAAMLRLDASPDISGYVMVERAAPPAPQEQVASTEEDQRTVPAGNGFHVIDEPGHGNAFLKNLSVYQPIYFLVGPSPFDAKFQLSFKYQLFTGGEGFAKRWPFLSGLYFAYTQRSFWDLHSPSRPFTDSSFSPEFFYRTHLTSLGERFNGADVDMQMGIFHESNGKSGADSRSLNAVYLRPSIAISLKHNLTFSLAGQVWDYVGSLSDNPNIGDYRGHVSILASLGNPNGLMVSTQLRGGISSGKGNVSVDASYPLNALSFSNLDLYFYVQLYHGYGEDLINYDKKDTRVRLGFAFVR